MKKTTIVEPILFGYMFCLFAVSPMEEQLIYRKVCARMFNSSYCEILQKSKNSTFKTDQNFIQEQTANWQVHFSLARTLPAIAVTLTYGVWSDYAGRKKFMILPIVGDSLLVISLIINSLYFDAHIVFMLIGTLASSLFGNFSGILFAIFSYAADVSSVSFRTKRTIILECMVYSGSILSNLLAGFILQHHGFVAVFVLILCVYALLIVYWFFLKESYPYIRSSGEACSEICHSKAVLTILKVIFARRPGRIRATIIILIGCFFCTLTFFIGINSVAVLYMLHQPLNFTSSFIGYFFAELNALKSVGALAMNFLLLHWLKWHENRLILISSIAYAGFSFCIGFSSKDWQIFVSAIWAIGLGVGNGSIRGRLSKLVSPQEQGKMFSFVACVEVLVSLFSSTLFNSIYKSTVHISPSIVFYLLGSLSIVPITFSMLLFYYGEQGGYSNLKENDKNINDGHQANVE